MSDLAIAFLGIIALATLVQAGFLIGLALKGMRLSRRVGEMQQRYEREIRPLMESASRVSRNAAEASDLAVLQVRRVDDMLASTFEKVDRTTSRISEALVRPLGPLANATALLRGVQTGLDVYRALSSRGRDGRVHVPRRPVEEDEHLFI